MRPSDPWLRSQLAPARTPLLTVVGSGVVAALLVLAQAWAVTDLVLAVLDGAPLLVPAAVLAALLAARGLVAVVGDRAAATAAARVGRSLRRRLIARIVERDLSGSSGEAAVLTTRGVAAVEPYLTRYLPALVLAGVLPALTVVVIATQDLLSALIVVLTLPLIPVFGALVGLATRDRAEEQWREMASLSGHFLDVVRGLPTLVVHRRARAQTQRIAEISDRYRIATVRTLRIAFASSLVLELVATLSVALVAVTTGVRLAEGSLGLHTALVVLLLAPEAYWPLRRVGAEFHAAAEGVATFEQVRDLLDVPSAAGLEAVHAGAPVGAPLVLREVAVTHPGRTEPAVSGVSAVIPAEGVTVLTGPSGSGKSTLLDAIAGLVAVTSGEISADGSPVGGPSWRQQIAWLPQRPRFVVGTLADNLRLERPEAPDTALWLALRQVALEERVRALPGGLGAVLGEDGLTLSAGERARLALARVIVADRPWTLLDEPTAHLDELTERVVNDTVAELGRRGAVVVVAHRPGLIELADHRLDLPTAGPPHAPELPVGSAPEPTRAAALPLPTSPVPLPTARFGLSTALSALASASGVALTATAGWLIVQASSHPVVLTLLVAVVGVRTFGLARPVLRYAERLRSHDAALRLLARRRVEVYESLIPLTPARLGARRGDLLSAVVDDVDGVVDHELRVQMPWRAAVGVGVIAVAAAAVIHPLAALPIAVGVAAGGGGAWLLGRAGARSAEQAGVARRAELGAVVVEIAQLGREHRMWGDGERCADTVAAASDRLGAVRTRAATWTSFGRAWALGTAGVTMAAVALLTADAVALGDLSGPMMALLVLLPLALAEVMAPLADAGALSVRTRAAQDRLGGLAHTPPAVGDGVGLAPTGDHHVSVDRVRASWADGAPVTAECSLTLSPGQHVGLVGASGSGKSTLAALLLRFLDPVTGVVRHGGQDLRSLSLDDVRRSTGLVDDDPHVFATTVVENVRLARSEASDAEVRRALLDARLGPWLAGLPDGLETWLGDGHAGISGGERARLGVARALLADPPVLVLDEPTSHLDHATACEVAHEVLGRSRHRAVLWITHSDVGLDLVDAVVDLDRPVDPEPVEDGARPH